MRPLHAVLLLGACASDPETTGKSTTPPIPDTLTTFERLRDPAGVVAGLPGFQVVHRVDPTYCGGIAVDVKRTAQPIAEDDAPLADILAIRFPTGLDFNEPTKTASLKIFDGWVQNMSKRGAAARAIYSERMLAKDATHEQRVIAAARIVQLQRHLASRLVRAQLPRDVRSGDFAADKSAAFCDRLEDVAEAIMLAGEGAAKVCADHAADIAPGWWTSVCSLRPTTSVTASVAPSTTR
jgi:hypothetical protein